MKLTAVSLSVTSSNAMSLVLPLLAMDLGSSSNKMRTMPHDPFLGLKIVYGNYIGPDVIQVLTRSSTAGQWNFKLPSDLPSGEYLLRTEFLGLRAASKCVICLSLILAHSIFRAVSVVLSSTRCAFRATNVKFNYVSDRLKACAHLKVTALASRLAVPTSTTTRMCHYICFIACLKLREYFFHLEVS